MGFFFFFGGVGGGTDECQQIHYPLSELLRAERGESETEMMMMMVQCMAG